MQMNRSNMQSSISNTSPHKPYRRKTSMMIMMMSSMKQMIAQLLPLIALLTVLIASQLTETLPTRCVDSCIEPFSDLYLPDSDRLLGIPATDGLGRVVPMPVDNGKGVKYNPSKLNSIKTNFEIFTRRGHISKLEFEHKKRPIDQLGIELCDIHAPYPLNFSKLTEAHFDASKRTVILIGGYLTLDEIDWFPKMLADRWLEMQDLNIIIATWKSSNQGSYENAIANIPYVARQITIFLYYLARMNNLELHTDGGLQFLDNLHIYGHSCGSHIAGFVGKDLAGLVGRITGFDPAGPHFDEFEPAYRLDKINAKLVDVYHSNAGKLDKKTMICSMMLDKIGGKDWMCPAANVGVNADPEKPGAWLGIDKPIGHLDIYLNNGHKQPGCYDRAHLCDHGRADNLLGDYLLNTAQMLTLPNRYRHRPLAFRATDYKSFQVGDTFRQNKACSWIMGDVEADRVSGELGSCSVAINFMKSPSDYRRELEQMNGIKLSKSTSDRQESLQYYLATSGDNPILPMHHFILKLKLAEIVNGESLEPQWDDQCRLNVELSFANKAHKISMQNLLIDPDNWDEMLLALPFSHPRGLDIILNEELEDLFENAQNFDWIEENKADLRGELFPAKLQLSSSLTESHSTSKTAKKQPGPTKFKLASNDHRLMEEAKSRACQLDFVYAIIEPVWTNTNTFYGQFVLADKYEAGKNDSLDIISIDQWNQNPLNETQKKQLTLPSNLYENIHVGMSDEPIDLGLKTIIIDE